MSDNPLISVVIPVYNVEQYLSECVDSVISQTYKNLDIILVDDGSPDRSPAICDEYANKDNRVRVIHKANGGPGSSRNAGIRAATGEYITFIDSDDYISRVYLEQLYKTLIESNTGMSCCTYSIHTDKINNEVVPDYDILSSSEAIIEAVKNNRTNISPFCKLYKTNIHMEGNGIFFPEEIMTAEDFIIMPQIFNAAGSVAVSDNVLYYYRQQDNSLMHTMYSSRYMDYYTAYSIVEDYFKKQYPDKWSVLSKHFRNNCIDNTMKILRNVCIAYNKSEFPYERIIAELTGKIHIRDIPAFLAGGCTLPKKLMMVLTAFMPKLAVKIMERSKKYTPVYK